MAAASTRPSLYPEIAVDPRRGRGVDPTRTRRSAGAVSFGQIVKAAEPAFAAVLSQFVYGKPISKAKWLCLIPVIGGVIIASVKELDFAVSALVAVALICRCLSSMP